MKSFNRPFVTSGKIRPEARSLSTIVNRTVPRRAPNSELRPREYLSEKEIERLQETARKRSRYGHRDATMILVVYRPGIEPLEPRAAGSIMFIR